MVPLERIAVPLDDGVVGLLDRALLELPLQARVGGLALGDGHHARRADVEPVHDALALGRAGGADAVAGRREAADHGRAGPARAGVGGHADGLVDHHDVVVVEEHAHARHRLGRQRRLGDRLAQVDARAGSRPAAGRTCALGRPSIEDGAVGDEVDGPGAGQAEQPGEGDVEALPGEPVGDGQQALGHATRSRRRRRPENSTPRSARQHHEDGRAGDEHVGHVEHGEVGQLDEVDDVAQARARGRGSGGR